MKINALNPAVGRKLAVRGKKVPIKMIDRGQSAVLMTLTINDADFEYPNPDGTPIDTFAALDPGTYVGALSLISTRTPAGGATFDSEVTIGGVAFAGARGTLDADVMVDRGLFAFTLVVS